MSTLTPTCYDKRKKQNGLLKSATQKCFKSKTYYEILVINQTSMIRYANKKVALKEKEYEPWYLRTTSFIFYVNTIYLY